MGRTGRDKPSRLTASWPDIESPDPDGEVARQFVLNLSLAVGGAASGQWRKMRAWTRGPCETSSRVGRGRTCTPSQGSRRAWISGSIRDEVRRLFAELLRNVPQMRFRRVRVRRAGHLRRDNSATPCSCEGVGFDRESKSRPATPSRALRSEGCSSGLKPARSLAETGGLAREVVTRDGPAGPHR